MKEWCGQENRDPKTGRYGYWRNPNAKWDWYSTGGRWAGHFLIKPEFAGLYKGQTPNFSYGWDEKAKSKRDKINLIVNQAKWAAATSFCKSKGIRFIVLTEKDLGI